MERKEGITQEWEGTGGREQWTSWKKILERKRTLVKAEDIQKKKDDRNALRKKRTTSHENETKGGKVHDFIILNEKACLAIATWSFQTSG